jgi:uroporphyrinogen decarboxylase
MNKRKMTSKERVLATFAYEKADRVPINYSGNPGITKRLMDHYELTDYEGLLRILGVDFKGVGAAYKGGKLHEDIPERGVIVDNSGIHRRWIEHETGGYWDYCDFPLKDADEEKIAQWKMPSPDDFDYSGISERCEQLKEFAINGSAGFGDLINGNGMLRTMEQTLVDLITDDPAGLLLADRRFSVQLEMTERILEKANGGADFIWLGEDLGTQIAPLISIEIFRKHIRPRYQKFCDLAKAYNIPAMIHTCGSSSWAYEDFIEMGIKVVDTLQPEAYNMSPKYLKETFGGRLAFHGCISTAGPLASGTVQEAIDDVKNTLEIMMPGGGYCLAPTHAIQDNSPTENVVAMYETAHKFGVY